MKAIPTKYRNRLYRSRLKAKWASFFDKIGWEYEYEPIDLDGWIPDFEIKGINKILVEIKPVELDLSIPDWTLRDLKKITNDFDKVFNYIKNSKTDHKFFLLLGSSIDYNSIGYLIVKNQSKWHGLAAILDCIQIPEDDFNDISFLRSKLNKAGIFVDMPYCSLDSNDESWAAKETRFLISDLPYEFEEDGKIYTVNVIRMPKSDLNSAELVPGLIKECWDEASNEVMYLKPE